LLQGLIIVSCNGGAEFEKAPSGNVIGAARTTGGACLPERIGIHAGSTPPMKKERRRTFVVAHLRVDPMFFQVIPRRIIDVACPSG
jgi:hypothetical protein